MNIHHNGAQRIAQMGHAELFASNITIDEFMSTVDKICKIDAKKIQLIYGTNEDVTGVKHYKGDIGEVFGEYLIAAFAMDPRLQVKNFVPTSAAHSIIADYGVDGYAENVNGDYVSFQFKYKSNTQSFLNSDDHMGNFYSQSSTRLKIPYEEDVFNSRMIVITTCQGIHPTYHQETFSNAFKVLNIVSIRNLVDGNAMFWNGFIAAVQAAK